MTYDKTNAQDRKDSPIYSGVLRYFPDALWEVARVSKVGNDQHNPGEPLHWAKEKSTDQGDCLVRHLIDAGTRDTDGQRHSAKVAWRALALLQREIEAERGDKAVEDCDAKFQSGGLFFDSSRQLPTGHDPMLPSGCHYGPL